MAADTDTKHDIYSIIESEPWKGRVLFTGPDMIGDHRVTVQQEHRQIGIGTMSPEGTSETDYLWRASTATPFPRPRSTRVGEVGWGLPVMADNRITRSGRQIVLGEFRQLCENGHTHRYQNPWYPGPKDEIDPDSDAALVMNVYKPKTPASRSGQKAEGGLESDGSSTQNQQ